MPMTCRYLTLHPTDLPANRSRRSNLLSRFRKARSTRRSTSAGGRSSGVLLPGAP